MKIKYVGLIFPFLLLLSCNNQTHYIPKPATYLEFDLPTRDYARFQDSCGYSYNKPAYFEVKSTQTSKCNRDIDFSTLNGTLFLSSLYMDTTLDAYVNYAIDKIEEHKVKATAIFDSTIIRNSDKVYGTFFELQGNVASPFQFYLTDSTSRFISGVVYFNAAPNYDSLKPVLNFVKDDLYEFMNTLEWDGE